MWGKQQTCELLLLGLEFHHLLRQTLVITVCLERSGGCDNAHYLFERILDIKANRRHFACLSNAMDPGKCLLLKGRIPATVSYKGNVPGSTDLNTSEALSDTRVMPLSE